VYVGESVAISLCVRGRIVEPLEFPIRDQPRLGKLGAVKWQPGSRCAQVLYTPRKGVGPGTDFFTFAAQSVDSPVSVRARVQIEILPRPAKLAHPLRVPFEPLPLGDSALRDIRLANSGGSSFALDIRVNPPWRLLDAPPSSIGPGEEVSLALVFEPGATGDFGERLRLTSDGKHFVELRGSSFEPLSWSRQGLEIPSTARLQGPVSISFTNTTDAPRPLRFVWPKNILAPEEVEVPAKGAISVPVEVRPEAPPAFSFRDNIEFRSGNFSGFFPLTVHPAPTQLAISPEHTLELGTVAPGESATANFTISNSGGLAAKVRVEPHGESRKEVSIQLPSEGGLVEPGGVAVFQITVRAPKPGDFSHPIKVYSGDREIASLNAIVAARAALPVEKLLDLPPPALPGPAKLYAAIPAIEEAFLRESTPHTFAIFWKVPAPPPKEFFIERREVRPAPDGGVEERWVRWEPANIEISGESATARFRKLPAGTFWNIRIRSVDDQGLESPPPRGFFRIETQPLPPLLPDWFWWVAGPVALLLLYWLWKKLRAAQH
jgi:hypothetical protein